MATANPNDDEPMCMEHKTEKMMMDWYPKCVALTFGTLGKTVMKTLNTPAYDLKDPDFILTLCSADTFTSVVKMLNTTLEDDKPAVVMVLHSELNPKDLKARSLADQPNMITVDCLFSEDQGFLACTENDEAMSKIKDWLSQKKNSKRVEKKQPEVLKCTKKYFSVITGNTSYHDVSIVKKLRVQMPDLQPVNNLKESDLILHFCYAGLRDGTDINAAVEMLSSLAGGKPAVLMLLYFKCPPEERRPVGQNMIIVSCQFCEVQGFLQCPENNDALAKITTWLNEEANLKDKTKTSNWSLRSCSKPQKSLKYFTLLNGKTFGVEKHVERKLKEQNARLQRVNKMENSDLILLFCPVVSRAGTDIKAAVDGLNTSAGNKRAVLLVLHHTFDPNYIVPASRRLVQRENTIAVDFLFHEDLEFLICSQNHDALSQVVKWLHDFPI